MLAGLTVCELKRGIEIMKVQEAVAVYGVETVSTKDLLSCIIGDEKKAAKICDNNNEVFKMLNRTVDELKALGLTLNQAVKVSACMELLKRASHTCKKVHLGNPKKAATYLMPKLRYMEKEVFMVLALNGKKLLVFFFRLVLSQPLFLLLSIFKDRKIGRGTIYVRQWSEYIKIV